MIKARFRLPVITKQLVSKEPWSFVGFMIQQKIYYM